MRDQIIENDIEELKKRLKKYAKQIQNKNFLVTGGAGFLGSWMCEILLEFDANVTCQDNLSSGLSSNIDHLKSNKKFEFVQLDIKEQVVQDKFDYILHMSSRAAPDDYNLHEIDTLLTNGEGTKNVLELARESNCSFLFASTSEIYGDAQIVPTPESYWGNVNSIGKRSCYDEGKRYGEALCSAYFREFNLDIKIARIFNTYGPRIRSDGSYGRALSRFVTNAINNENLIIFGDGNQTRSFCYVTDTIAGLLSLILQKPGFYIMNIGSEKEITINELAKLVIKNTNSQSKIKYSESMPDDPKRRCPNISKARMILNWEPLISLEEGLTKTIELFRHNKKPTEAN